MIVFTLRERRFVLTVRMIENDSYNSLHICNIIISFYVQVINLLNLIIILEVCVLRVCCVPPWQYVHTVNVSSDTPPCMMVHITASGLSVSYGVWPMPRVRSHCWTVSSRRSIVRSALRHRVSSKWPSTSAPVTACWCGKLLCEFCTLCVFVVVVVCPHDSIQQAAPGCLVKSLAPSLAGDDAPPAAVPF
jgi:hypothetical protein